MPLDRERDPVVVVLRNHLETQGAQSGLGVSHHATASRGKQHVPIVPVVADREDLPDVHIEHMHPTAGKAEWDANYHRVNAGAMYAHDAEFFHAWMRDGIEADAERALAALR